MFSIENKEKILVFLSHCEKQLEKIELYHAVAMWCSQENKSFDLARQYLFWWSSE
jgi:hypothetical protein